MAGTSWEERISAALEAIINPRTGKGLISSEMVQRLSVSPEGVASFSFLLRKEDPATLVHQARKAITSTGAPSPSIRVTDREAGAAGSQANPRSGQPRVPAPTPVAIPGLNRVIAVSSGKGGVGKSTVAVNLAVALGERGYSVGILDADIYGPNIPRMMGIYEKPMTANGKIIPLEAHGIRLMSIGFLIDRDAPAIWRGPIITKLINQFLHDVDWGELDILFVDMPPGTGDAQLSLVQQVFVSGAVIVTTPQEVAVGDSLRGAKMFEQVNVPVLGVIENMSGFFDPVTGARHDIFGTGGGERLAHELEVPLLGQIPLQAGITEDADQGLPVVLSEPNSAAAVMLSEAAEKVRIQAESAGLQLPTIG